MRIDTQSPPYLFDDKILFLNETLSTKDFVGDDIESVLTIRNI